MIDEEIKKDQEETVDTENVEAEAVEEATVEEATAEETIDTEAEETIVEGEVEDVEEAGDEEMCKKGFFKKKKDKKDEQIEQLTDQLLRSRAEFDNYRKRTDVEKAAQFDLGVKNVAEKLLPIVDNFERGLATIPEEEKEAPFATGMDKVYKQMVKMLEDMGVTPIEAVGQPFDPNFHNAVMQAPAEDGVEENTVIEEFQKGYTYKGYVVRYSMVKVAI